MSRLIVALLTAGLLGGTAAVAAAATPSPKSHMVCAINQGVETASTQQGLCLIVTEPAAPALPQLP
jgi:hypothetical protein